MARPQPLLVFPPDFHPEALIAGHATRQCWRGRYQDRPAVLRAGRLPDALRPLVDPSITFRTTTQVAAELGLRAIVASLASGSDDGAFYLLEPYVGRSDLSDVQLPWAATAGLLAPIADDLVKLHQERRWHGGIRPSRLRKVDDRVVLTGLAWASTASVLTSQQLAALEKPTAAHRAGYFAPELLREGPAAAERNLDVYGLARTAEKLLSGSATRAPDKAASVLAAASNPDPGERPTMRTLAAAFRA